MSTEQSLTPLTDELVDLHEKMLSPHGYLEMTNHARELEAELTQLRAVADGLAAIIEQIKRYDRQTLTLQLPDSFHAALAAYDALKGGVVDDKPEPAKPEQPEKDSVRSIRNIPLEEGDWAVECTNPGHFLKVHPLMFGKLASDPSYSFFRPISQLPKSESPAPTSKRKDFGDE